MRLAPVLLVTLSACGTGVLGSETLNPYVDGGVWPVQACGEAATRCVARLATEQVGGTTRDFELLDQHGYRVRLSDFCGRSILLSVGAMDDPASSAWLDRIPAIVDNADPRVEITILTTWNRDLDGDVPTPGDVRRWSEELAERHPDLASTAWPPVEAPEEPIPGHLGLPVLLDPPRYRDAAPAAAAMWAASDLPEPTLRFRSEREVAGRYGIRDFPHFAVLHPRVGGSAPLRIVALGTDLDADGLITALQTVPEEWEGDPGPSCADVD